MRINPLVAFVSCFFLIHSAHCQVRDSIVSTKEIPEIQLKAPKKKQFADHAKYTFDKETIEKSSDALGEFVSTDYNFNKECAATSCEKRDALDVFESKVLWAASLDTRTTMDIILET